MEADRDTQKSSSARNWMTWALLALLPGLTGWCIVLTQKQIQQNRRESYQEISRQEKDEFLRMYEQWNRLSDQEKADTPWGTGPYGGPEIQRKLKDHQEERLLADLPDLLTESAVPSELGDILYGPDWREQVRKYQKQIEYQEILSIVSTILLAAGGLVFSIGLLIWLAGAAKKAAAKRAELKETSPETDAVSSEGKSKDSRDQTNPAPQASQEKEVHLFPQRKPADKKTSAADRQTPTVLPAEPAKKKPSEPADKGLIGTKTAAPAAAAAGDAELQTVPQTAAALLTEPEPTASDPILASLMAPIPVVKGLSEISEQMSAIREFAAEQQNQVRKFQDGYDWMLIKRFCLRIIRCIDNLEDRIRQLQSANQDVSMLKDIRDEILFALESSGVEQYEPEIGLEYKGLERYAESVREKKENDDPTKSGRIAEVVRPGYQYLINDEEVKIVRCAQVKLYA
ncbi:MAG TPA: hypothetical protein PK054_11645 [Anaerohalosphaeraceae bacterium]|nr:hypothetical protein [Anaerohalosphaeraceae bacterium]HOL89633.1 hypothetical protein [Anaerohalosphaeraceae bacterium]HPP57217.1 hypothetical protein [Anaerohalosphaeraceae bacterium]